MGDLKLNIKKQKPRIILEHQGKRVIKEIKQKKEKKNK